MKIFETPESIFASKIHEMTSNADKLIDVYIESLATIEALPADLELPNKQEVVELTELTLNTLMELKVTVKSLFEHSAEVNDQIDKALSKFNLKKD